MSNFDQFIVVPLPSLEPSTPVHPITEKKRGRPSRVPYKGVTYVHAMKSKPYRAQMRIGKKCKYFGYFAKAEDAAEAYRKALEVYGKGTYLNPVQ